jgi:hypothetical protein
LFLVIDTNFPHLLFCLPPTSSLILNSLIMLIASAFFPALLVSLASAAGAHPLNSSTFGERVLEETSPVQDACPDPDGFGIRGRDLQGGLPAPAIIDNGVIKLGINPTGQLNVYGGMPVRGGGESRVGLRYIFPDGSGESEATSYGCECEGWGVFADGDKAWANDARGVVVDAASVTFTSTTTTAISSLITPGGKLRITHDFHPTSATPNLYEVTVTLENLSGSAISDLRYRRVMDFDVYPSVGQVKLSYSQYMAFADCATLC